MRFGTLRVLAGLALLGAAVPAGAQSAARSAQDALSSARSGLPLSSQGAYASPTAREARREVRTFAQRHAEAAARIEAARSAPRALARQAGGGITVTTTADSGPGSLRQAILDANTLSGTNGGQNGVLFNIPAATDPGCDASTQVCTIALASPLPPLEAGVVLSGFSQPGSEPATDTPAIRGAQLKVVLDGSQAGAGADGVVILGNNASVSGLSIVGFNDVGIAVYGPRTGVLLYGNSVGVLPDGTTVKGNNIGIQLAPLAGETAGPTEVSVGTGRYGDANLIGGNNDGLQILNAPQTFVVGNLIGVSLPSGPDPVNVGNANNGIAVAYGGSANVSVYENAVAYNRTGLAVFNDVTYAYLAYNAVGANTIGVQVETLPGLGGGSPVGTHVYGNSVGIDPTSGAAMGNGVAVLVREASQTLVGVYSASASAEENEVYRNTIAGNLGGVFLVGTGAANNDVQNNYIGTDADGRPGIGNDEQGVYLAEGASGNRIGNENAGNTIAYNDGVGVLIGSLPPQSSANDAAMVRNRVRYNAIYANGLLGIDLGGNGVTANDEADADAGPNGLQNYPVLDTPRLVNAGAQVTVGGTLVGEAGESYFVDFYASPTADPTGFGEGREWIGSLTTTVPSSGTATFSTLVDALAAGTVVTATATGANVGTSEFSEGRAVEAAATATAEIQLLHASAALVACNLSPLDVYVDGALRAEDLTFGRGTPFETVPVGQELTIRVTLANQPALGLDVPYTVPAAGRYKVTLLGAPADCAALLSNPYDRDLLARLVEVDLAPPSTRQASRSAAGVVVYGLHASTDAPVLDVTAPDLGVTVADDLDYGQSGPFVVLPAEPVTIRVASAADGSVLSEYVLDLTGLDGDTLQVTAAGFVDPAANNGGPSLVLSAVDEDGAGPVSQPVAAEADGAPAARLDAPWPNPAAGAARVSFTVPRPAAVRLAVYDALGREVTALADGPMPAGTHQVELDVRALAPGVYLVRLDAEVGALTQRLTVVR